MCLGVRVDSGTSDTIGSPNRHDESSKLKNGSFDSTKESIVATTTLVHRGLLMTFFKLLDLKVSFVHSLGCFLYIVVYINDP